MKPALDSICGKLNDWENQGEVYTFPSGSPVHFEVSGWFLTLILGAIFSVTVVPHVFAANKPTAPSAEWKLAKTKTASSQEMLPVIVRGTVSKIYPPVSMHSALGLGNSGDRISIDFAVEPTTLRRLSFKITSRGLGRTLFSLCSTESDSNYSSRNGETVLELKELAAEGVHVKASISPDLVPDQGNKVEGHIVIYSPEYRPFEIPITLERASPPAPVRAALWFVGIALPAGLTAVIGLIVWRARERLTSKRQEEMHFDQFKVEQHTMLELLFQGGYQSQFEQNDEEFSKLLLKDLSQRGVMVRIPCEQRKLLRKAIQRRDRKAIVDKLASVFWEWQDEIRRKGK